MRRTNVTKVLFLVLLALVLMAGCAPAPTEVPTQVPTFTSVAQVETLTATSIAPTLVVPSATPLVATATAIVVATNTPTATPEPPTPVPPTATAVPPTPTTTPAPVLPTNTLVPPTPTATRVPPTATAVQITDWRGEYYDNPSLQGQPDLVRNDRVVDFDLGAGERPAPGIPAEKWSARWSRSWTFEAGNYRFQLVVDDGARLWVNGNLMIDAWEDGAPRELAANLYLSGQASIRLEYYNHLGPGRVRLHWERVSDYPEWKGSYYPVRDLSGTPRFERNDPAIDFDWGGGSPRSDMPVEDFSVRWTRRLQLSQGGTYRFLVVSDDGARLWVDGQLLIDRWQDGYTTDEATINLAAGGHDVRLEYYEHLGGALVRLTWSLIPATATATPTRTALPPTATPTTTVIPPTATSTVAPTAVPPSPTPTVPPGQPSITLQPPAGRLGDTIRVRGEGWPANAQVDIMAGVAGQDTSTFFKLGEAVTGPDGRFQTQIVVPAIREWQTANAVRVIARVAGQPAAAQATFNIQAAGGPGVRTVPYESIPTNAARFVLQRPTFLALDSAQAWATHFGQEPPPADPPINWQQEYVLGAFFVPEVAQTDARVESIMVQGSRVVIRLVSPAPAGGSAFSGMLVRVSRSALGIRGEPTFAFVDARGQVLASGQAGAALLSAPAQRQAPESDVPEAAGTPPVEPEPGIQSMPGAVPEEEAAELEAPTLREAPEAGAAPPETAGDEIAEITAEVKDVPWQQSAAAWIALLAWGLLVILLIAGVLVLIRRAIR
ncbi:MAG: hypothetical protein JXA93_19925 [Anaerolineae bacterium]|nr:hypothetical protein [Anaerolineae bacterium]